MPTTEEFLVGIGIDQKSLDKLKEDVNKATQNITPDPIEIPIDADPTDAVVQIEEATRRIKQEMEETAEVTKKAMEDADAALDELKNGLVAAGVAAAALTATLAKASSEAAGDEKAYNNLSIAFGDMTEAAKTASDEINAATGRATGFVQTLLADANLMVQAFGITGDEALRVSKQLTTIAINLSAVTGQGARELLQQFREGLQETGTVLKRYGINLERTRVEQELLNQGLDPQNITKAQEVLAKMNIFLADTARFSGAASGEAQDFTEKLLDLTDAIDEVFGELGVAVNEVLKPFISDMVLVVRGLRDWFRAHPRLTRVIGSLGIALTAVLGSITLFGAAVAGLTFAYKQYAALQTVVVGAQVAIAASTKAAAAATVAQNATLSTNTAAQITNAAATTSNAVAQSTVGRAARIVTGILTVSTGAVYANTVAWLNLTRLRIADFLFNAWTAVARMADGIVVLTGHLLRGRIGLRAWVNMVGSELHPALLQTVSSTSALTVAVGGLAAAYLGFKLGGIIEEYLGLADATERVMQGTAETSDVIKDRLVDGLLLLLGPLGAAGLAWKKYYEYQNEALQQAQAAEIEDLRNQLDPAAQAKYNDLLEEGVVAWRAYKIAVGDTAGEISEFQRLLGKRGIGEATREDLLRLEELYTRLSVTVPDFGDRYAEAMGRVVLSNKQMTLSLQQAEQILTSTQKQFDEIKQSLDKIELRENIGEGAAKSYEDLQKLNTAMELFRNRAAAHRREVEELSKFNVAGVGIETTLKAIREQEQALAELSRLANIAAREQTRQLEASFQQQEEAVRASTAEQIRLAEERKNRLVEIERARIDEIKSELDRELGIRKTANDRLLAFEAQLDAAALRRRDAVQADIQSLRESAQAALEDASNQEVRARVLQKVTEEIERRAATDERRQQIAEALEAINKQEARDLEAVAAAQKALNEARSRQLETVGDEAQRAAAAQQVEAAVKAEADARERLAETQERAQEAQEQLTRETTLQEERQTKAAEEIAKLNEESARQADEARIRDEEILSLQQEKLEAQQNINAAEREFQTEVQKSKTEYEKKVEILDDTLERMKRIVELQRQVTELSVQTTPEARRQARELGGELAAEQNILQERVKEQRGVETEQATFDEKVAEAVDALKLTIAESGTRVQQGAEKIAETEAKVAETKQLVEAAQADVAEVGQQVDVSLSGISQALANLRPATDALTEGAAEVEAAIQPVAPALDESLNAQDNANNAMTNLGKTVVEFAAGSKARWNETTKRLEAIESQVRSLSRGGEAEAAAGYGG